MNSRTKMLLGVLGALVLLSGWYLLPDSDSGVSAGTEGAPPGVAGATPRRAVAADAKKPVEYVEELRVADLVGQAKSFTPGRDPFRFFVPPPPPPPKPRLPTKAELDAMRAQQERDAAARAEQLRLQQIEAAKPKPAPFTMTYLGSFGPPEKRLAVFTDGKTIYNTQQGEVLDNKFIVAHIGYESVDIQFVGFPDWPALRLAVGHPSR
ncbi:MAG TPA: hypothetical protein VH988_29880 [Thermoanaerobaculia bacterium]|jgi:hypothetical protein|nr:hypothetical protein [Thermoanaerobaculia bacterium]